MNASQPSTAELAGALRSERVSVQALVEVLVAERQLLTTGNLDGLPELAGRKRELLLHIAHLGERRNRLLERCGATPDRQGMDKLLAANPGAQEPRREWEELLTIAEQAHRLNHANGVFIEAGTRANQQALSVLLSAAHAGTYGPGGRTANPLTPRSLASA